MIGVSLNVRRCLLIYVYVIILLSTLDQLCWSVIWRPVHNGLQTLVWPSGITTAMSVCWSLTSLCHSNGHIETMPAREIYPFTALTRIRSQFLRTQWSTSNHSEWIRLRIRLRSHRGWLQRRCHLWVRTWLSKEREILGAKAGERGRGICTTRKPPVNV